MGWWVGRDCGGMGGHKDDSFIVRRKKKKKKRSSHITQKLCTKSIMSQLTGIIMSGITAKRREIRAGCPPQPPPFSEAKIPTIIRSIVMDKTLSEAAIRATRNR